jgi:hypothetical protein
MTASLGILVIRSSLVDWRSMKKECRHARHSGGPADIDFPAVEGVLAVASISADPGIPILAGGFTSVAEFMDPLRES